MIFGGLLPRPSSHLPSPPQEQCLEQCRNSGRSTTLHAQGAVSRLQGTHLSAHTHIGSAAARSAIIIISYPHHATRQDGEFSVEGWLDCSATPDTVYDCLTDYANLANTFGNITDTQVLHGPHGGLQVKQVCKWEFLVFQGTFSLLLNVQEDKEARALTFDLVESGFMQGFLGLWTVWIVCVCGGVEGA